MSNFDQRAKEWDKRQLRVKNAHAIAHAIKKRVRLTQEMEIIDFGVGTGLLGFEIATKVKKVHGIDTSLGMIEQLKAKNTHSLHITPYHHNILENPLPIKVDGLISSMTLHHIHDIEKFFQTAATHLKTNGFIAIADLCQEDGTFHSDNSSVSHFGFTKEELQKIAKKSGFENIYIDTIHTIEKPHQNFDVFLLYATKKS